MSKFLALAVLPWCLLQSHSSFAFNVQVSEAPTDDLALTVGAIESAQKTLLLNIYELSSSDIADAILNRIQAGVHVEIIQEGQIVGGLSAAGKGIQAQIAQAMQSAGNGDRLLEMSSKAGGKRRYRYDHAKYAVIDSQTLLIGSENYSPTGNPAPGSVGNRGWEVLIFNSDIAQQYEGVFQIDSDVSKGDLIDLTQAAGNVLLADISAGSLDDGDSDSDYAARGCTGKTHVHCAKPKKPKPKPVTAPAPAPASPAPIANSPAQPVSGGNLLDADAVELITSPNLSETGLVGLINGAQTSIDIEQMTFDSQWGTGGEQSPLTTAVLAAIQRGVKVRVLLNDEAVFDHGKSSRPKNQPTIDLITQAGGSGAIANLKAMGVDYIHNKGVLVDGNKTLISSINWDENSIEHNREAAVVITSTAVNAHYQALFDNDWSVSSSNTASAAPTTTLLSEEMDTQLTPPATQTAVTPDSSLNCPDEITIEVQVGDLSLDDADADFAVLSGRTISGVFFRSAKDEGCVLSTNPRGGDTKAKMFAQFKKLSSGMISFSLQGYTPRTRKLYSIRAKFDSSTQDDLSCTVYNGREALGDAVVHLELAQ